MTNDGMTTNGGNPAAADADAYKVYVGNPSGEFMMFVFGPNGACVLDISETGGVSRALGIFYDADSLQGESQRLDFMSELEKLANLRRAETGRDDSHTNAARRDTPVVLTRDDVVRLMAVAKAPPRTAQPVRPEMATTVASMPVAGDLGVLPAG